MAKKNSAQANVITSKLANSSLIEMDKVSIDEGWNVRTTIDQDKIKSLSLSMKSQGLLNAITVQASETGFTVVAGHRRFLAAQRLNWTHIPAVVVSSNDALVAMMMENESRESLEPHEQIKGFMLLAQSGLSARKIAEKVGVSNVLVSERLKIGQYPELIEAMRDRGLSVKRAFKLASDAHKNKETTISEALIDGKLEDQDAAQVAKVEKRAATLAAKDESESAPVNELTATNEQPEAVGDEATEDTPAPTTPTPEAVEDEVTELPAPTAKFTKPAAPATKPTKVEAKVLELSTILDFVDMTREALDNAGDDNEKAAFLSGVLYGLYMTVGYNTDKIDLVKKNPTWESDL